MTVPSNPIYGPPSEALRALTPSQLTFLQNLPKAELHAHLNGSIPLPILQDLARTYIASDSTPSSDVVQAGLQQLQSGVQLVEINDFFGLFPAIYALTSTPLALRKATRGVLSHFLGPVPVEGEGRENVVQEVSYLELRTTPRDTPAMSRRVYLETVLAEVESYAPESAALIVSLDRRMSQDVAEEVVELAAKLREEGRRVVGVDLCGDPLAGDVAIFTAIFEKAKQAGLGVTLHIAETAKNPPEETLKLLSCTPARLGHATFLNEEAKKVVHDHKICIEICLTSNLLCKTVQSLDDHHIRYYLKHNHPIAICTDDILPFRNSMLGEYALLLAPKPYGLGLTESEVETIARMSMECRFPLP
ncbi:adenosine deaminase-like protein [Stereum hirsutum FP-91666 SS1]|uniref:adenosine deaminase-like protein n=1 Tax=Stereum hirsutum (strain FP-91666) TaxID=721885 RepID=UPI000440CB35|nr:adenosine deaminase-like protein [Stereum hirsutum FP-91666 SS1]EIM92059.1 adenosine deaminase-like protein [Stereum hirsutum FP-91666 SS1]